MNIILAAAALARTAHEGQFRKYHRVPYVMHPARVAARVALLPNATENMVAAAFLHDVIEDTPWSVQDIEKTTNKEVAALVVALTNTSKGSKLPREDRKAIDRAHLVKASPEAKLIKMIDRLDNLADMAGADGNFKVLYAKESLLLAETVGDADAGLKAEILAVCEKMIAEAFE